MFRNPNIVWPAAIIGLLLLSVVTSFAVMLASQSDGGVQVVDDYYRKSVAWDSIAAARNASELLGWSVEVDMEGAVDSQFGVVTITDRDGGQMIGLAGAVSVTRPQSAASYGSFDLAALEDEPGRYRFEFPFSGRGLWDLNLEMSGEGLQYSKKVRIEI